MNWRLLEGGGQAIYELGVADSGALVGLAPDDLRATLDTLRAMAAEIGARVVISKEIEVTGAALPDLGFRALAEKRHGSRDGRRTAVKNQARTLAIPVGSSSPQSSVSAASTPSTSSSSDSTRSLLAPDSSLLPESGSSLPSPSSPSGAISIPVCKHEMGHGDDPLGIFPVLTEAAVPTDGLLGDEESFIGCSLFGAIPKKSLDDVESRRDARSVALAVPAVRISSDRDEELLLAALEKLKVADGPLAPEEHKRMIVEATVIRELDLEEGFLDFSSF
jgi:hypothetical protein